MSTTGDYPRSWDFAEDGPLEGTYIETRRVETGDGPRAVVELELASGERVSLWLSAMNVQFRDVHYTIPFLTQAWLFITPIAYPSSLLPEPWRTLYGLNPMAGVVEGFRWALLGTDTAPGPMTIISAVVALALFVTGAFYFRRMEQSFADVL